MKPLAILVAALAAIGCGSEPDPRYESLRQRVEALESRADTAAQVEWVTSIEARLDRVEDNTPGIGYVPLGWRTWPGSWIAQPDVRGYRRIGATEVRASFIFRGRHQCPPTVRVRVYAWPDLSEADPAMIYDRRESVSAETCGVTFTVNEIALFIDRVEFLP